MRIASLLFYSRAGLLLLLVGCGPSPVDTVIDVSPGVVRVETVVLEQQPWVYSVDSFGQLNVADTVRIGVESPGTVASLDLVEGRRVQAGQLLFELDANKQQSRYQQAGASVEEAQAQLGESQKTLQRFIRLRGEGAVSEDQLLQAQTRNEAAIARLQQARATLDIARTELAERRVVSPVDGVLESESVEVGQYVQPGQVLAVIQADGALQVSAHVNEREVLQIATGQSASVEVAGAEYAAIIESVGRSANPATGNYEVKLRIQDASSQLREGMSARVRLQVTSSEPALVVPRTAVVDRERARVVFVVRDGRAEARRVKFGLPDQSRFPVLSGLEAGDELILAPMSLITDGTVVDAENGEQ